MQCFLPVVCSFEVPHFSLGLMPMSLSLGLFSSSCLLNWSPLLFHREPMPIPLLLVTALLSSFSTRFFTILILSLRNSTLCFLNVIFWYPLSLSHFMSNLKIQELPLDSYYISVFQLSYIVALGSSFFLGVLLNIMNSCWHESTLTNLMFCAKCLHQTKHIL